MFGSSRLERLLSFVVFHVERWVRHGGAKKETIEMGEHIDEAKGRTKEAAGDLTDDEKLKREGKIDRAVSTVKDKVDDVADKVKEKVGHDRDPSD
jgi:uncharacterized protein YjbJ (UPF0337 family)